MIQRTGRKPTSTSNFGVGRREGHDSSSFYARFTLPEISSDDSINRWKPLDPFICGDSACMKEIPDNSVALVVTSPPYFVGKEYEEALGKGHIPATYVDYLDMLYRVFKECKRVLEPGGRIAVNVANLGRRPYRSLSADVIQILQNDLKFLLRGEVIWQKAEGASGSCAWGSFRQASNPVLRDITERVIIACKGRFDRAKTPRQRKESGLPYDSTISSDEFLEATLDLWEIPPESAIRVGHPAPFPVELPERLIGLYTFEGDLVLDPFMGSGSTLVAAARTRRWHIGYDVNPEYVEIARQRVEAEVLPSQPKIEPSETGCRIGYQMRDTAVATDPDNFQARASQEGKTAQGIAERVLRESGFKIRGVNQRIKGLGLEVNFIAEDEEGGEWYFDVSGAFTTTRPGLRRTDTLWKALGRTLVLTENTTNDSNRRIVLLTTHLPQPKSAGDVALRAVGYEKIFDVIEMYSDEGKQRLMEYATGKYQKPLPGFWCK